MPESGLDCLICAIFAGGRTGDFNEEGVEVARVPFAEHLRAVDVSLPGKGETSMNTDEDPLRGLLFYQDLGFAHTLHVYTSGRDVSCGCRANVLTTI